MPKKFLLKNRRLLLAGAVIIVAGGAFGLTHWLHHRASPKTATVTPMGPETPQVSQAQPTNSAPSSPQTSATTNTPAVPADQTKVNASLTAPSGQLNKKTVSLGSNDPKTNPSLDATCQTLAGATCVVKVTGPSGQTATITDDYHDGQGSFVFDWSASGYATGTWQVELIATKDGQTGTANIGPLTVGP